MNSKILTLLGFASKSGNLSFGMNSSLESIKKKKAKIIVIAKDVSGKSQKEIKFYADKFGVEALLLDADMETLSNAIGKRSGIVSVNDEAFLKAIKGGTANG